MAQPAEAPFVYLFPSEVRETAAGGRSLAWPKGEDPFHPSRALPLTGAPHVIQVRSGAFTPDECARIVAIGEALPAQAGGVEKGDSTYRVSRISWIVPAPDTHWLFHRLALLFHEANARYGFDLAGFVDALQYTVYGPGEHFGWHMDLGPDRTAARKLSMSVQLTAGSDYSGGALEFVGMAGGGARAPGDAIIFPAYMAHRVTPIEAGIRRSLVAWACGPSFR
ncbi:MAG: 2OG-Fe(II) oxygenase [Burkholderiales bacterium]|nr:2OG-Fe(II) oxygenase [Burkholderiales bacterium]